MKGLSADMPTHAAEDSCELSALSSQSADEPRRGLPPKIPSMVFELDLEDGSSRNAEALQNCYVSEDLQVMRSFLLPSCQAEMEIANDADEAARVKSASSLDAFELAQLLSSKGYAVTVRKALGGGEGPIALKNLRHHFVIAERPGEGVRVVVDPAFKAQFMIAKPTERYTAISSALPECLVMREDSIPQLVTFLCIEMMAAFHANDVLYPPWRSVDSMLSKWLPKKASDDAISSSKTLQKAATVPEPLHIELFPLQSEMSSRTRSTVKSQSAMLASGKQPFKVFKGGFCPVTAMV